MIVIPETFKDKMRALHGDRGEAWSNALPDLIAECADRFDFRPEAPFGGLSYNFVLRGTLGNGKGAVLKLSFLKEELVRETDVLRAYEGRGAIRVLDADGERGGALLEAVVPGTPLSSVEDDDRATEIFCGVFRRLHPSVPTIGSYPSMKQHFAALDRCRARIGNQGNAAAAIPEDWLTIAEANLAYLIATTNENLLLHGDLHHANMLRQGEERWAVIDPKGIIGDIHFEPIQYLLNYEDRGGDRDTVLRRRIAIMADRLGLDSRRIAMWGVARGVLEACWGIEDGSADWPRGIRIAERFAGCAE